MTKKKWFIGLLAIGILGGAGVYIAPMVEESNIENAENIEMDKFDDMEEVSFEILDTSAFNDENLEKWFVKNQSKKGEFVYYDNTHTYILVSGGEDVGENQLISLDGVRSMSDKLIVGYEFKDGEDFGVIAKDGVTPSLLLRTKGEFQSVKGITILKEEPKIIESQVTDKVNEGEEAESEEASDGDVKKDNVEEVEENVDKYADIEESVEKEEEKKDDSGNEKE